MHAMRRLFLFLLLIPAPALAQTSVSGYLATDATMAENPLLVGLTAAREAGPFAARLSLGFDVSEPARPTTDDLAPPPEGNTGGIWNTDADALLYLGNPRGGMALIPYALAGIGVRGYQTDGKLGAAPNYSYGGGFRAPLGGGFAMEGEIRHREVLTVGGDALAPATTSGMEYRFGFSIGWGGARVARPVGVPGATYSASSAAAPTRMVAATLSTAERFIGVPYLWGGNTPGEGFDCSGFVRYVFRENGLTLPRVSRDQARVGQALPLDIRQFQAGDLIAFASNGGTVDHIAIYAGNGRIIHSSSSGRGVRYDDLFSRRGKWYVDHMVAARRVVGGGIYAAR